MDIFTITHSKTRQLLLRTYFDHPESDFYLRELERKTTISAGNLRRELLSLSKLKLFIPYNKGRLVYYKINTESDIYQAIATLMHKQKASPSIVETGYSWMQSLKTTIMPEWYCQTRDVFQVRLQTFHDHMKKIIGADAHLITAIAGEIGNNSFDHNLGNWPDISGVLFAHDTCQRSIILADKGQGVLATIKRVKYNVKDDCDALRIAFTEIISGRKDEHRGNGLKFVLLVVKNSKWIMQLYSGNAVAKIDKINGLKISTEKKALHGCFAIIRY